MAPMYHPQSQTRFWLIFGAISMGLLYLLAPVLTPFLIAALLAYLGDPLIDRLEARRISRSWAVTLVFGALILGLLLLVVLLIPLSAHQFHRLLQHLPRYIEWIQTTIVPWLRDTMGINPEPFELDQLRTQLLSYAQQLGGLAGELLTSFQSSSTIVFAWLADLVLIPLVTFYLLRDWDLLVAKVRDLLPRHIEPTISKLARESDGVIGAFLRGQFIVMSALGVIYSVGLSLIGLEFSLLIGLLAGLISFVPYLGLITGVLAASVVALLQFHSFLSIVWVLAVFGIGQLISDFLLTPLLVGDRIGLHPVAVMFAVLAGGHLFGFFGILLALPVAAVIVVILRHVLNEYLNSNFYNG